jgi:hypothetical protein
LTEPIEAQARAFAEDLTRTVSALVPDVSPFSARALTSGTRERFAVRQEPDTGVPLLVDGQALLTLKVKYECALDGVERYLAVDESLFWVFAGDRASGEPLLRYHYRRAAADDLPSAHLHVHAHRDATSYVMARSGEGTTRGKRRARATDVPHLHDLHFPLGGHRFRPCLEDLLEMLVVEFGVDSTAAGLQSLRVGREDWRRKQLRSVVRDDPEEAADLLRSMGYSVEWAGSQAAPGRNSVRFRDF